MPSIEDDEFGKVTVRRSALARYVRVRIAQNGSLSASLPLRAPLRLVEQLINQSRDELRSVVTRYRSHQKKYLHGEKIGKSHILSIEESAVNEPIFKLKGQSVNVHLPLAMSPESQSAELVVRSAVRAALTKQAKAYLPRRVRYLAEKHGFDISEVRFNNAKTRWGSCSSKNNINLNVALMQLPYELIDYVIVHELCHTSFMDHSPKFWQLVESIEPDFVKYRRELKKFHAYL